MDEHIYKQIEAYEIKYKSTNINNTSKIKKDLVDKEKIYIH